MTQDIKKRLDGVEEAVIVNVIGLNSAQTVTLRKTLRDKNIQLLVVKNSLARRATEGTPLAPALADAEGTLAIMWGAEDIVSLAKEATRLTESDDFKKFESRGGVMEGTAADRRESRGDQQVAQPLRAAQHPGGADPGAGPKSGRGPRWSGCHAGQPD